MGNNTFFVFDETVLCMKFSHKVKDKWSEY